MLWVMLCYELSCAQWWQGWPSGKSTWLPPMWPGFDFCTRRHMWIEFVGSLLSKEGVFPRVLQFFPGYSAFSPGTTVFPLLSKPT